MKELEKKMEEIVVELKNHKAFIMAQCTLLKDILQEIKEIKKEILENGKHSRD